MGVWHDAVFGIGVKLVNIEFEGNHRENMYEFLEEKLSNSDYIFGEVGSGAYTGEENDFYIFIENPLEDISKLKEKITELKKFLKDNQINYMGDVGLLGGVHTC